MLSKNYFPNIKTSVKLSYMDEDEELDDRPVKEEKDPANANSFELTTQNIKEESLATYIVPMKSTEIGGATNEAAVIDADVQIANGVLRAVAAGWKNVNTLGSMRMMAKLTLDVVERRRKLLNHQHGARTESKTGNLNDYLS